MAAAAKRGTAGHPDRHRARHRHRHRRRRALRGDDAAPGRRDDGRHATVAFTDDWAADARRRDFTINALYCSADGEVFDPLGGYCRHRRRGACASSAIPRERIREDYLRILRFFRFTAEYRRGPARRRRPGGLRARARRARHPFGRARAPGDAAPARSARARRRAGRRHATTTACCRCVLGAAPRPTLLARLAAIEGALGLAEREADQLDVAGVGRILTELDSLDEEFIQEVRRRVPIISSILMNIRAQGATDFVTASQLDPILEQVEALYNLASQVQATMITMFLQGLRSFLMVAAYRKTSTLAERLGTVETRIHALIPMAEQWGNLGRVERSAIGDILPV